MQAETRDTIGLQRRDIRFRHRQQFFLGVKTGIPIAVGYIPIAITFGLVAKSAGVPTYASMMMSFLIYAGASQFVGVQLLTLGATPWEILLTTFILNLRHFLMTASISQRIQQGTSKNWMALLAFGITDETFAVASLQKEQRLHPVFLLGLNLTAFSAWNLGTWTGLFVATGLPESIQSSMGIALYAMFIGLLIPSLRKSLPVFAVALIAMTIQTILHWVPLFSGISGGWGIIIATIVSAVIGSLLFPKGVHES
jgi:4-azaleucine resistance transporter AzlC